MSPISTSLKSAILTTLTLTAAAVLANPAAAQQSASSSPIQHVLCIQGVKGPGVGVDYPDCMEVLGMGLSVGRQMKSAEEKGGTFDISIGVGELSPVSVRKPTDGSSALLFAFAANGNSMGDVELFVLEERAGWSQPLTTLEVKLDRSFVQSLELDASALVENVEIYFNKIQLTTFERDANGALLSSSERCWDKVGYKGCSL